jgi:hypothetical protein
MIRIERVNDQSFDHPPDQFSRDILIPKRACVRISGWARAHSAQQTHHPTMEQGSYPQKNDELGLDNSPIPT